MACTARKAVFSLLSVQWWTSDCAHWPTTAGNSFWRSLCKRLEEGQLLSSHPNNVCLSLQKELLEAIPAQWWPGLPRPSSSVHQKAAVSLPSLSWKTHPKHHNEHNSTMWRCNTSPATNIVSCGMCHYLEWDKVHREAVGGHGAGKIRICRLCLAHFSW